MFYRGWGRQVIRRYCDRALT